MERKVIQSGAREVIIKVKEFCEREKNKKGLLIPLDNVQMRVAALAGITLKTLSQITKEPIATSISKKVGTPGKISLIRDAKSSAREVILKVKEFCEREKMNKEVLIPLSNVQKRVAAMAGISVKTVSRITKEPTETSILKQIVTPAKTPSMMERKVIKSAARKVILKMKEFCEQERSNKQLLIPLSNVQKRVAAMAGISVKTVSRISKEKKATSTTTKKIVTPGKRRPQPKRIDLDDFELCAIRQKVHFFYIVYKELPTVNKLRLLLKEDMNFQGSNSTLRRILKMLGFQFKRCQYKRKVLMERYDITAWRARYIEKMRKNRFIDKRPVVYVDETHIHNTYDAKSWQEPGLKLNEQTGLFAKSGGSRWMIAHAGTENGFIDDAFLMFKSQSKSSDYHDDMNSSNFLKWMTENLIPNLPERCLVVMDNAPYHCTQINKPPTMSNLKVEMQEWLQEKGIYFEESWTKPILFGLIKENRGPPVYAVDELLREHDHEVLKLPPYHCDLNPIVKMWSLVKKHVAEENVAQDPKKFVKLTKDAFASITPEQWSVLCKTVEQLEDEYFINDRLIDAEMDRYIISTESDSETDSDSDSDVPVNDSDSDVTNVSDPLDDHNYI